MFVLVGVTSFLGPPLPKQIFTHQLSTLGPNKGPGRMPGTLEKHRWKPTNICRALVRDEEYSLFISGVRKSQLNQPFLPFFEFLSKILRFFLWICFKEL